MTIQRFSLPKAIGAANVQVFSPRGAPLMEQRLATPGDVLEFEAQVDGLFQIRIDPVGEPAFLTPVEVDASRSVDLSEALTRSEGRFSPTRLRKIDLTPVRREPVRREPAARDAGPLEFSNALKSVSRALATVDPDYVPVSDSVAFGRPNQLGFPRYRPALALDVISPSLEPIRSIAVGVSLDEQPLKDGGWRPFDGPWEIFDADEDGRWTVDIIRDLHHPPLSARNARVRVHVAVERTRIMRLLVPLFVGGVRLTLNAQDGDVGVVVRPIDPTLHTLMQALGAGSEADPMTLLDYVATNSSPETLEDPWAAAAFGLLALRKHPGAFTVRDAMRLADWCPWFSDASIIAANLILAQDEPDVPQALRRLSHARKVGAPYFTVANEMMGDLLVILAADAKSASDRATAQRELRLWRKRVPFQSAAGSYFAWITQSGARNRGNIDTRYARILFRGSVVRFPDRNIVIVPQLDWDSQMLLDAAPPLPAPRLAIADDSDD